MNMSWFDAIASAVVMGCIAALADWFWSRDARRAIAEWCSWNCVEMDHATFVFSMGRPAHASLVGTQDGKLYFFKFTLHSSILSLPPSLFQVWGKVVLRERASVD